MRIYPKKKNKRIRSKTNIELYLVLRQPVDWDENVAFGV